MGVTSMSLIPLRTGAESTALRSGHRYAGLLTVVAIVCGYETTLTRTKEMRRMTNGKLGTRGDWLAARAKLLVREKEHTRLGDDIARERRELPWVLLEKEYRFDTEDGVRTLAELFDGRSQLIVYHFMFGPDYEAGCVTCSSTADSFNSALRHLEARDVTMICISRAPLEKLLAYRRRMGWSLNWASSYKSDFNFDFGVSVAEEPHKVAPLLQANEVAAFPMLSEAGFREGMPPIVTENAAATGLDVPGYFREGHGVSTFARDGDDVYHCYSSYARGTEFLMGYYAILDRTPTGRDEGDGRMWLRRHDEYNS
jgi:predicted dithiol-disulfide oxidoreductase (DUF899 family)